MDLRKEVDNFLTCLICRNFLTSPTSLADCSHTFCSECLRRYRTSQVDQRVDEKCPTCNKKLQGEPVVNRTLTSAVDLIKRLRETLPDGEDSELEEGEAEPPRKKRAVGETLPGPGPPPPPRQPPPSDGRGHIKPKVLKLMKNPELKKQLKEWGLNPKGDRKELLKLYNRFVDTFNASLDGSSPMTKAEVAAKINLEMCDAPDNSPPTGPGVQMSLQSLFGSRKEEAIDVDEESGNELDPSSFEALTDQIYARSSLSPSERRKMSLSYSMPASPDMLADESPTAAPSEPGEADPEDDG